MKKPDKRNDVTALDKAIFHLVEKNAFEICLIVILGISLYARIVMIPNCVLSADYNNFIVPWVNKYRELGIVNGLATKLATIMSLTMCCLPLLRSCLVNLLSLSSSSFRLCIY